MELHHQFLVSPIKSAAPPDWRESTCGPITVHSHQRLPTNATVDKLGSCIGQAIGWAVTAQGTLVTSTQHWPVHANSATDEEIESLVYGHGGRFLCLIVTKNFQRIYMDSGGTLSMVYSPNRKIAASTVTALAWNDPDHPVWHRRPEHAPAPRSDQFLPAGLTAAPTVFRVLPNHYLDLLDWRSVRHYPKDAGLTIAKKDFADAYGQCANILSRQIEAFAQNYSPLYITLTAGDETRAMLACSKAIVDRVEFVTIYRRNKQKNSKSAHWWTSTPPIGSPGTLDFTTACYR